MIVSPPTNNCMSLSPSPSLPKSAITATTPTPSSTRKSALSSCVQALVSTISSTVPTTTTFASLATGETLRMLLRDAGFSCSSSLLSSQSGQSSSSESSSSNTSSFKISEETRASQHNATILLSVRDEVERTLNHASGELIPLDDVLSACGGSTAELAHIIELVLVCCCVHGARREAHIGAIMSMDVGIQAEIMDVIHYHVGVTEDEENNSTDNGGAVSPLVAKFRAMMSPEGSNPYILSARTNLTPIKSGSPLPRRQLIRRDSMDSVSSMDSMDRFMLGEEEDAQKENELSNWSSEGRQSRFDCNASTASVAAASSIAAATEHEMKKKMTSLTHQNKSLVDENSNLTSKLDLQSKQIVELKKQLDQRTKDGKFFVSFFFFLFLSFSFFFFVFLCSMKISLDTLSCYLSSSSNTNDRKSFKCTLC